MEMARSVLLHIAVGTADIGLAEILVALQRPFDHRIAH
jgi:hypothetical protein